jgi:phasin
MSESKTEKAARAAAAEGIERAQAAAEAFASAWGVPYEVPEAFRALTEQTIEQARRNYVRMKDVAEETTDLVDETLQASRDNLLKIQLRSLEAAKANTDASFELARKLLGTRTLADVLQLQTAFARDRFDAFVDYAKDVQTSTARLVEDTARPAQKAFTKALKTAQPV